jgi:hypothetical protein
MTGPLLTPGQLIAVQEIALRGMVTPVEIYRRTVADSDYGDDETITYPLFATVDGWLYSRPTLVMQQDTGALVADNTYRLFLPVGTNILSGDRVTVDGAEFTVIDTTRESTWPALLTVSLRRRE